jgi:hypothetical protein
MKQLRMPRFVRVLAVTVTAFAVFAGASAAKPFFSERFHEEGTFVEPDFCGAGLTVNASFVADGRLKVRTRGKEGLHYFAEHVRVTTVFAANGTFVTDVTNVLNKDLRVTDNGDGTLTVLLLATGNSVLYGPDGKAIARNPGQSRFELLLDDNGTPEDPFDDIELGFELVKGSTGRTDDFCAAALDVIG